MKPYRLPLKFILLWIVNLAVIVALVLMLDLHKQSLLNQRNLLSLILAAGAILAGLEQALWNKIKGNE